MVECYAQEINRQFAKLRPCGRERLHNLPIDQEQPATTDCHSQQAAIIDIYEWD